jgi:small subunit ribosomal protein S14
MKKLIQKDKKNRLNLNQIETQKFILKTMVKNTNFSNLIRWNAIFKLISLPPNSSRTFITNRCVLTGRKKRVNKHYKFSRIAFLKLVRFGQVYGMKKSVW